MYMYLYYLYKQQQNGTLIMIFNFQVYKILSSTKDTCTYILIPMHSSFKPEELKPFFFYYVVNALCKCTEISLLCQYITSYELK